MVAGYSYFSPLSPSLADSYFVRGCCGISSGFIECTATDYLKDNYDIIGFDPRGVADSTPVYCGQDSKL